VKHKATKTGSKNILSSTPSIRLAIGESKYYNMYGTQVGIFIGEILALPLIKSTKLAVVKFQVYSLIFPRIPKSPLLEA